ncbi:MAG: hypothetical protein FWC76_05115 [Defluviitaleaceae bacterium]|nr:hypothetical protein [Defluviitaleaceae bacterium]
MELIPQISELLSNSLTQIANNSTFQVIAISQNIKALYGGLIGVREEFFIKKIERFIISFMNGINQDEDALKKFLEKSEKKLGQPGAVERLVIAIDRMDYEYKVEMVSALYIAWKTDLIDWATFNDMLSIVERWMDSDGGQLLHIFRNFESDYDENTQLLKGRYTGLDLGGISVTMQVSDRCSRLVGLGVLFPQKMATNPTMQSYQLTGCGMLMSELLLFKKIRTELKFTGPFSPYGNYKFQG